MLQLARDPGLIEEPCGRRAVDRVTALQDLDGDVAVEGEVSGLPDIAHAAQADKGEQFVAGDDEAAGAAVLCEVVRLARWPPSLIFAVVRGAGLWSLANAFEEPVKPVGGSLVGNSSIKLDAYWGKLTKAYGSDGVTAKSLVKLDDELKLKHLQDAEVANLDALVAAVLAQLPGGKS